MVQYTPAWIASYVERIVFFRVTADNHIPTCYKGDIRSLESAAAEQLKKSKFAFIPSLDYPRERAEFYDEVYKVCS